MDKAKELEKALQKLADIRETIEDMKKNADYQEVETGLEEIERILDS